MLVSLDAVGAYQEAQDWRIWNAVVTTHVQLLRAYQIPGRPV